jgi:GT2 family glycosyltransferase
MRVPIGCYKKLKKRQNRQLKKAKGSSSLLTITVFFQVTTHNRQYLTEAVNSIVKQKYAAFNIYLINDTGCTTVNSHKHLADVIEIRASFDDIKKVIAEMAKDTLILFMPCVGKLHQFTFKKLATTVESCPQADLFYFDEDLPDENSQLFKPAWNKDLLYSHNYIGDCFAIGLNRLKQVLSEWSGPYDAYSLLLQAVHFGHQSQVVHIPYVLFHRWQPYMFNRQGCDEMAVVEQFFAAKKIDVDVEPGLIAGAQKVVWSLPKSLPLVSIIIPTRNAKVLVQQCIDSILGKTSYTNFEIILVDNQSDDIEAIEYFCVLQAQNSVKLLHYDAEFNYSAINNFAARQASGSILVFLNNDIEILTDSWLEELVSNAIRDDIGCVGAKLFYPNGCIQHAGVILGLWGCAGHGHKSFNRDDNGYMNRLKLVQNYSAVTAACMAIRKEVFDIVEGFNEEDLAVAFNDVDLCLKVNRAGFNNLWTPYAQMIHHESVSRGAEDTPEKKARELREVAYMQRVWHTNTISDPAYNPNLTLLSEGFSLREY